MSLSSNYLQFLEEEPILLKSPYIFSLIHSVFDLIAILEIPILKAISDSLINVESWLNAWLYSRHLGYSNEQNS